LQFVETALGSASEARYLLALSVRLDFVEASAVTPVNLRYAAIIKSLQKLLVTLRPKTED